jgi:hypothetical protein
VRLEGLSANADWRDLKDFLRTGGEINFARVNDDGTGIAQFATYGDMKDAISKLNGTEFQNSKLTIYEDGKSSSSKRRSRSYSPKNHSRSRSPKGRKSMSRSRSPMRSVSRSP